MPRSHKRIGYFIETGVAGGAEEILFNLACLAKAAGYEPVVFHFPHPWLKDKCIERGVTSVELSIQRMFKSTATLPIFAVQFARVLRSENVALLHSHLFGPIVGGGLAAFLARIPHLATLHDIYMVEEKPLRIKLLQLVERLGTRFVAVSQNMRDFYTKQHGIAEVRCSTIYNYCELNKCEPNVKCTSNIKLFVVGRLIKLKRVDRVISVFCGLAKEYSNIELVIVGEGEDAVPLKQQVPKNLEHRISFLGRREDVASLLCSADIFIQFSETEGLSMSILEAIATGLPAVVSDVGGNSELVVDGVNGFLVPADNDGEFGEKLAILIKNSDLREKMGRCSQAVAAEQFSKETFVEQYFSLYNLLLSSKDAQVN